MRFVRQIKVVISRIKNAAKKYFKETSLHGFRYITQRDSNLVKSFFWAFVCITSTFLCFTLILRQLSTFEKNRINTSIKTTAFPIWQVPFPAVTICNFNLVQKNNVEEFRQLLRKKHVADDDITNFFLSLSSLLHTNSNGFNDTNLDVFVEITQILEDADYNTERLMRKLAQKCETLVTYCVWKNIKRKCNELFRLVKTNEGFCCSFNYQGNSKNLVNSTEELFVAGIGPSFGLEVHLDNEQSQYMTSVKKSYGLDVIIHESIQYPDMYLYSTTINPGSEVTFSVKPQVVDSDEDIRSLDMETRGCAFRDEIKMEWSKDYNFHTCISECKAKAIMELCECVPFYYPIKSELRFCNIVDSMCFQKNQDTLKISLANNLESKTENTAIDQVSGNAVSCNCYAQCDEVTYTYQIDQEPIIAKNEETINDLSILNVYFSSISCLKIGRSINLTWDFVLASIGGIIGLCLGGSILSVIELLYHIFDLIFFKPKTNKIQGKSRYEPKLYISDFNSGIKVISTRDNIRGRTFMNAFKPEN